MARMQRRTTVGVRVSKATGARRNISSANKKATVIHTMEGLEPRIINKTSHRNFVNNLFAIRGRTTVAT